MEYNTSLPPMIIPEYGRNIQKMIAHAVAVEDREERNKMARAIIDVMGQLNPHLRDINDFKHKLWDHLFIISDFKLDVDSPYPRPEPETFTSKPDRVDYPHGNIRFLYYGKTVENLIKKAIEMEEGDMKENLVETIANLMKKFYGVWNREVTSDDVIIEHLDILSKGKLKLKENTKLLAAVIQSRPPVSAQQNNPARKKKKMNRPGGHKKKF